MKLGVATNKCICLKYRVWIWATVGASDFWEIFYIVYCNWPKNPQQINIIPSLTSQQIATLCHSPKNILYTLCHSNILRVTGALADNNLTTDAIDFDLIVTLDQRFLHINDVDADQLCNFLKAHTLKNLINLVKLKLDKTSLELLR